MDIVGQLLGNFGVTWGRLLGQVVTFVILLVGMRFILYKPMLSMLDERKQRIAKGLKDAEDAAKAKAESKAEAAEHLKQATRQAEELLVEAHKAADRLKGELMDQTQQEIARLKEQNQHQLDQAKAEMLRDVHKDIAHMVVTTTEKVLRTHMNEADQRRLAEVAAKEL